MTKVLNDALLSSLLDPLEGLGMLNCEKLELGAIITSRPNLRSGRGLNQSCSSPRELSNSMSHYPIGRRDRVDSRLLVVGSQTASLTPGPSFAHNLGCGCPNDSYEVILDIYSLRPFQWYQENPNTRCFDPCNQALSFRESRRTPSPQLWECEFHPHTWPKWGCDNNYQLSHLLFVSWIHDKMMVVTCSHGAQMEGFHNHLWSFFPSMPLHHQLTTHKFTFCI